MAKTTGFLEQARQDVPHRPVDERVKDFREIDQPLSEEMLKRQASRCMDCGIPFCHGAGCPLHNRIPEFNDLVYRGRWREASENLHATNNFPEITGRLCPALCEASCSLSINDNPVLIRHIECQLAERAWAEGWIVPQRPARRTGKRVAIIGSGPAGLAAAQQLARAGHGVTVFEKDARPGGLLRYGIPDFKLDKRILDRRLEQLRAEGVEFQNGVVVGQDISPGYLRKMFDVVLLTMGAGQPRDLNVPGRDLAGVHLAMEFLTQQNRLLAGEKIEPKEPVSARGKVVAVIGGGDTGSDCVGTARRQQARAIWQLEILPQPPENRPPEDPWPNWPRIFRVSTSHEEGCNRRWSVLTQRLVGRDGRVAELHGIEVQWTQGAGGWEMKETPGTEFVLKAELVLLDMGFVHVVRAGLVDALGLELDRRGNIVTSDFAASSPGVFAAGDAAEGASLVVRAIASGRQAAETIDPYLRG